ncbi:hypothetical protein GCM10011581_13200 [Saccharopolyspora subtropica]|uniref:Uncharacterized protein n=1 Tax=Saccharopolyspora thermophila TaxID=89367 RepID=A0A917JNV0_9PSEU|nr:hypothetical protein GCM10011581_13200 [Saccharopolyspora subtropica]
MLWRDTEITCVVNADTRRAQERDLVGMEARIAGGVADHGRAVAVTDGVVRRRSFVGGSESLLELRQVLFGSVRLFFRRGTRHEA